MAQRRTRKMVNLAIEETSGVDHPAHLHEGWLVMKAADPDSVVKAMDKPMKTEDGTAYPAAAFAYVPDAEKPSTWKLRLWESPEDKVTRRQVGMAVAALGEGFRGQKVEIPADDLAAVKGKVRQAWSEVHEEDAEMPPVLKSTDAQEGHMEKSAEERLEEALESLSKAEARIADMEKAAPAEPAVEASEEDMLKEAPEAVRKAFEAVQKQAEEAVAKAQAAEEALRKERDDRADAEAVEKAAKSFSRLGLDPEVVGPALRRLADADESLAKAVETALTAADAKVESADIFTEIGRTAPQTGSAFHKAESMAKAAVADGTAATLEQALSNVFVSDPALYTEYLSEKKG